MIMNLYIGLKRETLVYLVEIGPENSILAALKYKSAFSFRGLRPPDPLTRGFAPGPHWGLSPQTPNIGSRSTRSPWAPAPLN